MSEENRILTLLKRIEESIWLIENQTKQIRTSDDFLIGPERVFVLSGVCMQLIYIGESVKSIDNKTNHLYLKNYPEIPWSEIMGLRDIIAHEYHRIDAEEVFQVIKKDLSSLLVTIQKMSKDLATR